MVIAKPISMQTTAIPNPVIAVVAEVIGSYYYNHTRLNTLFTAAGAVGEPPDGNCVVKCEQWLKNSNNNPAVDAHAVLGRVIENFMEIDHGPSPFGTEPSIAEKNKERISTILAKYGLYYAKGGSILRVKSSPASESLSEILRNKNLPEVEKEFKRAMATVETDPPSGVTAACSLLEALFKTYIEDHQLILPTKQTIGELYKVVKGHLRLDPSHVAADDLKRILSGLISTVDGIGSLRTHAGSAHGHGRTSYRIAPRHARLAINAAHTLAFFLLETWSERSVAPE